jgi:hypothetical protein
MVEFMDRSKEYIEVLNYIDEQIKSLEKDRPTNQDSFVDYHRGIIDGLKIAHMNLAVFYSKKILQEIKG